MRSTVIKSSAAAPAGPSHSPETQQREKKSTIGIKERVQRERDKVYFMALLLLLGFVAGSMCVCVSAPTSHTQTNRFPSIQREKRPFSFVHSTCAAAARASSQVGHIFPRDLCTEQAIPTPCRSALIVLFLYIYIYLWVEISRLLFCV